MNVKQLSFLYRLIEKEIRSKKRGLTRLSRKPGQAPSEFRQVVSRAEGWIVFLEETLRAIGVERDLAIEEGDDA